MVVIKRVDCIWAGTEFIGDQPRLRQACANVQTCLGLHHLSTQSMEVDEYLSQNSDS